MKCLFVLCGHMSLDLEETLLYSKVTINSEFPRSQLHLKNQHHSRLLHTQMIQPKDLRSIFQRSNCQDRVGVKLKCYLNLSNTR